ncbi:hypothetical protein ABZ826_31425 [Streptomyces sp. NPDC047515]|uniref:hypothetical protein n=1 Tax=Streptomyces sp. NPDC047515 TaxID=3155380 RepID=UPI003401CDA7
MCPPRADFDEAVVTVDLDAGSFQVQLLSTGPLVEGRRSEWFSGRDGSATG